MREKELNKIMELCLLSITLCYLIIQRKIFYMGYLGGVITMLKVEDFHFPTNVINPYNNNNNNKTLVITVRVRQRLLCLWKMY